ncbi:type 1 glutamine amidotransferase domain-containing protein [Qipengyuania nanhaisediminis]|uniref:type 1 glutamine amidotransferase domain-containing protein n=1 Tax=Qipengyuania nanhaisediminis TaxID=604088 RepID=UPI0038B3E069
MKKFALFAGIPLLLIAGLALALPSILNAAGLHPEYEGEQVDLSGKRALIVTTSHATLNVPGETSGDPTGVFGSEMTEPYYEFLAGGMEVDIASINGGEVPIDPQSFLYMIKTQADERFLEDAEFQAKVQNSIPISAVDVSEYDVIYLAGGWGPAYDFPESAALASLVSEAYYADHAPILAGVCHGPLGFVRALDNEGNLLIAGRRMTGVTDKQVKELGIEITPYHPETELRKAGALFESQTAFRDMFANHTVIDDERRFVTGQNQNAGAEVANTAMVLVSQSGS